MGPRIVSFVRPGNDPEVPSARGVRYAHTCMAGLRWLRDALGLLSTAVLLAWLVVRFTH